LEQGQSEENVFISGCTSGEYTESVSLVCNPCPLFLYNFENNAKFCKECPPNANCYGNYLVKILIFKYKFVLNKKSYREYK
jgi:hypothetical protein